MQCPNWVSLWVERFKTDGLDGLRVLPRSGRPRKVDPKKIEKVILMRKKTTPAQIHRMILEKHGVSYSMAYIRMLHHHYRMTTKSTQRIHVNHAKCFHGTKLAAPHQTKDFTPKIQRIFGYGHGRGNIRI